MSRITFLVVASAAAFFSMTHALEINLSGNVLDVKRNPVPNAKVCLSRAGMCDTTDQTGAFTVSGTTGARFGSGTASRDALTPLFDGAYLTFMAPVNGSSVSVDLVDLSGRRTAVFRSNRCAQGVHRIDLFAAVKQLSGLILITITVDQRIFIIKTVSAGLRFQRFAGESRTVLRSAQGCSAASAQEITDTLIIVKDSFLVRKRPIISFTDTLDSLVLYPRYPAFTSADFPAVDGSTSAQPLDMVITCHLLGCSYGWVEQADLSKKIMAYSSEKPQLADSINTVIVKHNGTHDAYVNVIDGTKQIAFICRPPSPDERHLSDSLAIPIEYPDCALDAFVFIENKKNPVNSMALEQTIKIYTGAITRWDSLGGWPNVLQPYQREANSGSQELLIALVMKDLPVISAPSMVLTGMMGPFNRLAIDTNGFCYTVYFYQKFMAPTENIKTIAIDGIVPDYENIQAKRYPLFAPVVAVTRKHLDPTGNAAILREWLLAPEGQAVVKESGYVPIIEP
jgi:phosphate transport system substrate-binding protein